MSMKTMFVCSLSDLSNCDRYERYIIPEISYVRSNENERGEYIIADRTYSEQEYVLMHNKTFQKRREVITWITKTFNRRFPINFSDAQWDFVLGGMLSSLIFSLYDKFEKISEYEGKQIEFYSHDIGTPQKIYDFNLQNDEIQAYIYSVICKCYRFEERAPLSIKPELTSGISERRRSKLKVKILNLSKWPRYALRARHILFDYLIIHCSLYKVLHIQKKCVSLLARTFIDEQIVKEIEKKSNKKIVQLNTEYYNLFYRQSAYKVDEELRECLFKDFAVNSNFDAVLKACLIKLIPIDFIEGLMENYKEACKIASVYFPQKIYTAAYLTCYTSVHSLFAAIKREEGVELIDIQHGDGYISNKTTAIYELQSFDKFITSGWNESYEYGNVKPLMEARHWKKIAPVNTNRRRVKKILLISGDDPKYEVGVWTKTIDFRERHRDFVDHLNVELRNKLTVRLREDVRNLAQMYHEDFPEVHIHKFGHCSLSEDIMNADLVVCDHRSSPYFESLLYNKPTLLYDGMLFKLYNHDFEVYIEKLGREGLYYREGGDLALFLNENVDKIVDIWNSDDNQNLIRQLLNDVMNIDKDPRKLWYDELMG